MDFHQRDIYQIVITSMISFIKIYIIISELHFILLLNTLKIFLG